MPTIEEILKLEYVVIETGDHAGRILSVHNVSSNNNFMDCKDSNGNRFSIAVDNVRLATQDEILMFLRL